MEPNSATTTSPSKLGKNRPHRRKSCIDRLNVESKEEKKFLAYEEKEGVAIVCLGEDSELLTEWGVGDNNQFCFVVNTS